MKPMSLMRSVATVSLGTCLLLPFASAYAGKSCVELRAEIDAKLKNNGVQNYVLAIVPKEEVQDGKILGVCEGATKKITYSRMPVIISDAKTAAAG